MNATGASSEAVALPAAGERAAPYPAQIDSLTSLRFLAASWVVFFHLREYTHSIAVLNSPMMTFGYLGVDFFFVLSGFVLTHVYKRDVDAGRFNYWGFISKRFGRIYPMHLATLAAFIVLGAVSSRLGFAYSIWDPSAPFQMERGAFFRGLITHLTLIQAWGSTDGLLFNLPSWSISAEWFAYLIFPIYMLVFRRFRVGPLIQLAAAALIFVVMAAVCNVGMRLNLTAMTWNVGILRIFPEFLLGVGLYNFGQRWSAGALGARIGFGLSGVLVLLALFAAGADERLVGASTAVAVLGLAGLVLFAADATRAGAFRMMSAPFLVLLGEISYSVYMLHLLVGIVVFDLVTPAFRPASAVGAIAAICGMLALITFLSWLSYRLIEVPGRRAVVGWARQLDRPAE
ncbi:acyltransferase [Phenylobacterium sp.]|uniref:acyltransferase family protein n=1 Tax=Phenylobacterium sp. TaxID=1871053 RepID=UPI0025F0D755|nr:acyltransferase [Phenylobacterium sp.]